MDNAIVVALITGGLTLIGTIITVIATSRKTNVTMQVAQAVTDTKIETLTAEVKKHNDFATRLPVVEEQIRTIEHRVDTLEKKGA